MRSAISLLLIDPPHTDENSVSSCLDSSKNLCASPTLPPLKPAAYKMLSCAASENGGVAPRVATYPYSLAALAFLRSLLPVARQAPDRGDGT
jgi:hypothetical protein